MEWFFSIGTAVVAVLAVVIAISVPLLLLLILRRTIRIERMMAEARDHRNSIR